MATAGVGDWSKNRLFLSNVAKKLAHLVLASKITDPMSGFFIIRRGAFDLAVRDLSNQGYKILLDILLSAKPSLRVEEVPYTFRARVRGESKVEPIVVLEYFTLLFDKLFGHVIPPRFVVFSLVGGGGVLVHMAVLAAMNRGLGAVFVTAEIYAAIAAMIFNFFVNNLLTYSDMRLRGFLADCARAVHLLRALLDWRGRQCGHCVCVIPPGLLLVAGRPRRRSCRRGLELRHDVHIHVAPGQSVICR